MMHVAFYRLVRYVGLRKYGKSSLPLLEERETKKVRWNLVLLPIIKRVAVFGTEHDIDNTVTEMEGQVLTKTSAYVRVKCVLRFGIQVTRAGGELPRVSQTCKTGNVEHARGCLE